MMTSLVLGAALATRLSSILAVTGHDLWDKERLTVSVAICSTRSHGNLSLQAINNIFEPYHLFAVFTVNIGYLLSATELAEIL